MRMKTFVMSCADRRPALLATLGRLAALLGGVIVGAGFLAPAWHQPVILVTLGLVGIAFERWRAPDSKERLQLERDRRRDASRRGRS